MVFVLLAATAGGNASAAAVPLNATSVSNGGYHMCAIVGGAAQCWGYNGYGQLGIGDTVDRSAPVVVKGAESGVTAISSGLYHTCAIVNGGAKCWGRNPDGELSNGGTADVYTAVPVQTLGSGVTAISAGQYHTCAIVGGAVKCWGWNSNGQLGDGTNTATNANPPITVSGISGATAIAAGGYHTCALAGGAVKCWGYNNDGEIDRGATGDSFSPVAAVGLGSGVAQLISGTYHSCAILNSGAMKCWGWNRDGQLGDGTNNLTGNNPPVTPVGMTSGVTAMTGGGFHTCAVAGGAVKCWGDNYYGQLGINSLLSKNTPQAVAGLSGITQVSAGQYTSCALGTSGSAKIIHCWGDNYDGELGLDDKLRRDAPNAVAGISGATHIAHGSSASHSCVVIAGAAKCWGYGEDGQLGNSSTVSSSTPVAVTGLSSGVADVSVGYDFSCALLTSGAVKCWGGNTDGDVGDGSGSGLRTSPVTIIASGASAISAGYFHGCAIVGTGVKCWGYNNDGELGDGSTTQRNAPVAVTGLAGTPVSIASGVGHTCVVLSNGKMQCWGYNSSGQLGDDTTTSTLTSPPIAVMNIASGATQVAAGAFHTCAIVSGGAKCWGYGYQGQIGNGLFADSHVPTDVSGWTSNVQVLSGGYYYTCGVKSGAASCWGANDFGELGTGTGNVGTPTPVTGLGSGVTAISAADAHTCAIVSGGVSCWGANTYGETGDGRIVFAETPQVVVQGDAIFASDFEN
jgi:alpha-tubulin suppressor-like RCC1 family protein